MDNGKKYYYAVVAFTTGDEDAEVFPAESMKRILVQADGTIMTYDNTVEVTPVSESLGYEDELIEITHEEGFATGTMEVEIVDRSLIRNGGRYQIVFDDTTFDHTTYTISDMTDEQSPVILIENSDNYSSQDEKSEGDSFIDGMRFFLLNDELRWDLHTDANFLLINKDTGRLTGSPTHSDVGSYFVNISVWDLSDAFDFHNFTLEVSNVNDPPIWWTLPANPEVIHGQFFTFDANATDHDGDHLIFSISSNQRWMKPQKANCDID